VSASIWETLGIDSSADRVAIRRAYAVRLKAIDVEADPQAFVVLRAAFEEARACAGRRLAPAGFPDAGQATDPVESEAPVIVEAPAFFADAAIPGQGSALDEDARALAVLLFGDRPRAEIHGEVGRLTRRILASPELDAIERRDAVEGWMADTITRAIPRSDAMLAPAVRYFNWVAVAKHWNCPPVVRMVLVRYRHPVVSFCDLNIHKPGSKYHRAYAALCADPPRGAALLWNVRLHHDIQLLLGEIDGRFPVLAADFDPAVLERWRATIERQQGRISRRKWRQGERFRHTMIMLKVVAVMIAVLFVYALVVPSKRGVAVGLFDSHRHSPPPPTFGRQSPSPFRGGFSLPHHPTSIPN
jgi:hypothetical protein